MRSGARRGGAPGTRETGVFTPGNLVSEIHGLVFAGGSAFGLAAQLNIERAAAQQFIDRYFARYPGVAQYMRRTRELAHAQGYVETVFGRRLWLPDINAGGGPRRQGAERARQPLRLLTQQRRLAGSRRRRPRSARRS